MPKLLHEKKHLPILADIHMHTSYSHGVATVDAMFDASLKKGLTIVGFSEHSPRPAGYTYPDDYQEKLITTFPEYIEAILKLKERASTMGIQVLLGLEMDYIPAEKAFSRKLCEEYTYDYIIGGLHFQKNWGFDGPAQTWDTYTQEQRFLIYEQYYHDLTDMCETGLFQIAAHPDLIKIHTVKDFHLWLETPQSEECIVRFLSALKEADMAMEISSAGLRKSCNEIYPGPQIMELAAKMEVPISFGADAHCTETPAFAFDILARYANSFGYNQHVIFVEKQPKLLAFSAPPAL